MVKSARKHIFKGKLLNLYIEKHRFPNNSLIDLEIVKHPGAVLIVPFIDRNRIVLIKQYRPVIRSYIWELPAGTLDCKEELLNCARRELKEEIGYEAKDLKKIGFIYPAPGYTTEKIFIYCAYKLRKIKSKRQEDEIIRSRVFTKRDIKKMVVAGKIVDAKTICALKLSGIL